MRISEGFQGKAIYLKPTLLLYNNIFVFQIL